MTAPARECQPDNTEAAEALAFAVLTTPRPIDEYHEDMGPVLWWKFPIEEPPYVGSPNDLGRTVEIHIDMAMWTAMGQEGEDERHVIRRDVGGWPGYHTHFTLIPMPKGPVVPLEGRGSAT